MRKEKETKNFEEEEVIEEITNEEELLDSINAGVKGSGSAFGSLPRVPVNPIDDNLKKKI